MNPKSIHSHQQRLADDFRCVFVFAVMATTAAGIEGGGVHNEEGGLHGAAKIEHGPAQFVAGIEVIDFTFKFAQKVAGAVQSLEGPDQADIVRHGVFYQIDVLIYESKIGFGRGTFPSSDLRFARNRLR